MNRRIVWLQAAPLVRCVLVVTLCVLVTICGAGAMPETSPGDDDGAIPQPLKDGDFDVLVTNPPFTRSLGVSDSLILTGLAHLDDEVVATLLDTKTMASQVVSKTANFQGWQLVGVEGNPAEMQTWRARIQVPGGEVVSIRYQKPPPMHPKGTSRNGGGGSSNSSSGGSEGSPRLSPAQMDEAKNAAVNYKEGFNADGYPRQPPPEMVQKLSRLSVSQREDINRQMFGHRNQGLGLDERRRIYEGLVDRAMQRR